MNTIIGEITEIKAPFTRDGNNIQVLRLKRQERLFVYAELNQSQLEGFKQGDIVEIDYNLKINLSRRIVAKNIKHGSKKTRINQRK